MTVYELIKKHEGERLKPYKCTAGKWTVGVGFNFDDNKLPEDINTYLTKHGGNHTGNVRQVTDYLRGLGGKRLSCAIPGVRHVQRKPADCVD